MKKRKRKIGVLDIKIIPSYWGKGIGSLTLSAFIKQLDNSSDLDYYELTPNIENERAIQLYKKLGFKKSGKLERWASPQGVTIICQLMTRKSIKS